MKRIFKALVLSFALLVVATARPALSPSVFNGCPKLLVDCADEVPRYGETYTVQLRVEGADPATKLSYKWSVGGGGGEIVEGQGTPTLKVRCTHPENTITTTVEVGGLPGDCENTASCTFSVW